MMRIFAVLFHREVGDAMMAPDIGFLSVAGGEVSKVRRSVFQTSNDDPKAPSHLDTKGTQLID